MLVLHLQGVLCARRHECPSRRGGSRAASSRGTVPPPKRRAHAGGARRRRILLLGRWHREAEASEATVLFQSPETSSDKDGVPQDCRAVKSSFRYRASPGERRSSFQFDTVRSKSLSSCRNGRPINTTFSSTDAQRVPTRSSLLPTMSGDKLTGSES